MLGLVIGLTLGLCIGMPVVMLVIDKKKTLDWRYRDIFGVGYKDFHRCRGGSLSPHVLQQRADIKLRKLAKEFLDACDEERALKNSIAQTPHIAGNLRKSIRGAEWKVQDRKKYFWKIRGLVRKTGLEVKDHAKDYYCSPIPFGKFK